jgi:pyruvate dehydrogenase E1 component
VSYDPTYAYELAVVLQDGLRRMYSEDEDVFYYITLLNENYSHPSMPEGAEEGIRKGMYNLREVRPTGKGSRNAPRVQLLGSGSILREVLAAAELLAENWGVGSDVWSVPSFTELRRDGIETDRWNRMHPEEEPRRAWIAACLDGREGPTVASTDWMRAVSDQIRAWVPGRYLTLGTDGYGRSDTRARLRAFFEIDRHHVIVTSLYALAQEGTVETKVVLEAMEAYGLDAEKPPPWTV